MSEVIIGAVIGAVGAVVAAFVPEWLRGRKDKKRIEEHARRESEPEDTARNNAQQAARRLPRERSLPRRIFDAVREQELQEPFTVGNVRDLFPETNENYLNVILPNNAIGGNYGTNYFMGEGQGSYRVSEEFRWYVDQAPPGQPDV